MEVVLHLEQTCARKQPFQSFTHKCSLSASENSQKSHAHEYQELQENFPYKDTSPFTNKDHSLSKNTGPDNSDFVVQLVNFAN